MKLALPTGVFLKQTALNKLNKKVRTMCPSAPGPPIPFSVVNITLWNQFLRVHALSGIWLGLPDRETDPQPDLNQNLCPSSTTITLIDSGED
jgi:hypothetical protein